MAERGKPASSAEVDKYGRLAVDLVSAYTSGDAAALERLGQHYGRSLTQEDVRAAVWRRVHAVRQGQEFDLAHARTLIAREAGSPSWDAFVQAVTTGAPAPEPAYAIDTKENKIRLRRRLLDRDWDELIEVMREGRVTGLDAGGQMTDVVLERIAGLDHVTRLQLGGSRALTDDGLRHLARIPQLEELDLNDYPGGVITDRGLEVLRHLRELRKFEMTWQRGISDAGVANLAFCERLESVNLMGSPTGDGAIRALAGKPSLRRFSTGRQVTDAGLALLHRFPVFKTWQGGELRYSMMEFDAGPNFLLLDGPFTDAGTAQLAALEGVFALTFFWHTSALTAKGLEPLAALPHLGFLGCGGELCTDDAMRRIGALPHLRMLQAQGTVATDDGFAALARSRTLEYLWGRECPNLTGRGFAALSGMPALRGLAVSCKRVDDEALSLLPRFPSLTDLMPMDVPDEGFRHVGRCERLEGLWCMYCRDTTDASTEHVAGLSRVKTYYAGKTQITDRSLEILSRMSSLEHLMFWEVAGITDAGLAPLARLPRLREISVEGSAQVTAQGMKVFPAGVRVQYSV